MTAAEALRFAIAKLPSSDARALLAYAMGIAPDRLTLHLPDVISDAALASYQRAIAARLAYQPVAQIIGRRQFWRHEFIVTRDTLDPRPETEILVAEALRQPCQRLLDLGTGTGCILLSILASQPMAIGVGADISSAALSVAARNAAALGLEDQVQLIHSDWFANISGGFDLIVSNPPYIAADEMGHLSKDVFDWEPHLALTPGGDGLDPYRVIAQGAGAHLLGGGRILLEIGPTQAKAVTALLFAHGFEKIRILPDLDGRDRVVCAQKPRDRGDLTA